MGLAPYGEPRFADRILEQLIDLRRRRLVPHGHALLQLLPGPDHDLVASSTSCSAARRASATSPLTQREMDLAASIQAVTDEIVLRMRPRTAPRRHGHARTSPRRRRRAELRRQRASCCARAPSTTVDPARRGRRGRRARRRAASSGTSLLDTSHGRARAMPEGLAARPGTTPTTRSARSSTRRRGVHPRRRRGALRRGRRLLARGQVVGWFQGRMEFGPRALGCRSILGDPRDPAMQSRMNLKIKFRECFRPFAPAVLGSTATSTSSTIGRAPT